MNGPDERPVAYGREKPPLSELRYRFVEVLLKAGANGIKTTPLERQVHSYGNVTRILQAIRKIDLDWADAVVMAEGPNGRYKVRHVPAGYDGTNDGK